jgi:hypothetical protein
VCRFGLNAAARAYLLTARGYVNISAHLFVFTSNALARRLRPGIIVHHRYRSPEKSLLEPTGASAT